MFQLRPQQTLESADLGWLKARHHVAVTPEGDPEHGPLGALVVWNDDEVAPGAGFGRHGHKDMEIVTYVRHGAVSHQDSTGNHGQTHAGDVQVMSAGSGIFHAEHNDGPEPLKVFQIWLRPRTKGGEPRWDQRAFPKADKAGRLVTLASGQPEDTGALPIRALARVHGAILPAGTRLEHALGGYRFAYLAPSKGSIRVNGHLVQTGDGIAAVDETTLDLVAETDAEIVLVEAA